MKKNVATLSLVCYVVSAEVWNQRNRVFRNDAEEYWRKEVVKEEKNF